MWLDLHLDTEFFHTPNMVAYADLIVDGHRETWPIRGSYFRAWLRRQYYEETGEAPSASAIRSALDLFEARAQFDGPQRAVHVRTAEDAGRIYLDLADDLWRAVEISVDGWQVISAPPVRFRRSVGMLPLPTPQRGGSIAALASFLNLANQRDLVLVVAWLLAAVRHGGPYPLLALSGEQGSSKTVFSKVLRALVDPNIAPVRAAPREERELFIAANNAHLLAFDNLSDVPPWLSDALCRLASGGSFATRQLYTDADEVLFQGARPAILNGIEDVVTRPDLADRAIFLTLPYVPEAERRAESAIWREFEIARPRILGVLLDAMSHGLGMLPTVRLKRLPRMADFAAWATACETALWPAGTFMQAYGENRRATVEQVIDGDPVAGLVRAIVDKMATWKGSASDLQRLGAMQHGQSAGSGWPKSPRALAGHLRRVQPSLRALGIEIAFTREGRQGNRMITLNGPSAGRRSFHPEASERSAFSSPSGTNGHHASLTD